MSANAETRLQTLRRAIAAFRATPGRRGRVVHLQDVDEVLVGGDLHGHVENFRKLMMKADLPAHPRRHLIVQEVVHGPYRYADGSDKSHQLLDLVSALKCQYPGQVHFLVGNHELAQATGRKVSKFDLDLNELFLAGVKAAYGGRADEVYALYLELIAVAPLALRCPNGLYVSHSVPSAVMLPDFRPAALEQDDSTEADLAPGGSVYSLVWGRDVREETVHEFLRKVDAAALISGHVPCENGFRCPSSRHAIVDSQGSLAGYCLAPAGRPLAAGELEGCVHLL